MTYGIRGISIAVAVLAGIAILGTGWSTAESSDQAKLPGDAGPGPYVQGCVDCHGKDGTESIGALLGAMKHRNVDKQTTTVPGDCRECHSADGDYTPLSELAHLAHYENPGENAFIQKYGGNCLHCHTLDAKTGVVSVKSGPKNW
jgi:mono/diheme cytochrome c family protein